MKKICDVVCSMLLFVTYAVYAADEGACNLNKGNITLGESAVDRFCVDQTKNAQNAMASQQALAEQQRALASERERLGREAYLRAQAESAAAAKKKEEEKKKAEHDYFCKSQSGEIALHRTICEQGASERDRIRQSSCSDFSVSFQGVGWTNSCRPDSALQYRTDMITCTRDFQMNMNSFNAICNK